MTRRRPPRSRRALVTAVITTAGYLLASCSGSGHTASSSVASRSSASVSSTHTAAPPVVRAASSSATTVTRVEPEPTVARIVGRTLPRSPFPSPITRPTLDRTRTSLQAINNLGTAQDRKTERLTVEPAWGKGAFLNAYLLPGTADGTLEQVDAYTAHWVVSLAILTNRFLAAHELTCMNQLVHALPH